VPDFRIGEIDLGGADRRTVHRNRRLALTQRAGALIVVVLGEEAGLDQLVAAVEVRTRIPERRDVALRLRLGLVEGGPVVALIDLVEEFVALHVGAVGRRLRLDVSSDFGLQRDLADRFRASGYSR